MTQSFWASLSGIIVSVVTMGVLEHPVLPEVTSDWLLVSGHSLFVSVLNILTIVTVSFISPLVAALLRPLHLLFMVILQETLMREVLPPETNVLEFIGL